MPFTLDMHGNDKNKTGFRFFSFFFMGAHSQIPLSHLLQRLIDRHGAHGDRAISDDPLPRLVDVLAGAQVHEGVRPPERAPLQLLDLLLDRRSDGRIPDVSVDFHLEHTSDDLGLELEVMLVRRDDGASCPRGIISYTIG